MDTIYQIDQYRAIKWDGGSRFVYTIRGRELRRFSRKVETHSEARKTAQKWAASKL